MLEAHTKTLLFIVIVSRVHILL